MYSYIPPSLRGEVGSALREASTPEIRQQRLEDAAAERNAIIPGWASTEPKEGYKPVFNRPGLYLRELQPEEMRTWLQQNAGKQGLDENLAAMLYETHSRYGNSQPGQRDYAFDPVSRAVPRDVISTFAPADTIGGIPVGLAFIGALGGAGAISGALGAGAGATGAGAGAGAGATGAGTGTTIGGELAGTGAAGAGAAGSTAPWLIPGAVPEIVVTAPAVAGGGTAATVGGALAAGGALAGSGGGSFVGPEVPPPEPPVTEPPPAEPPAEGPVMEGSPTPKTKVEELIDLYKKGRKIKNQVETALNILNPPSMPQMPFATQQTGIGQNLAPAPTDAVLSNPNLAALIQMQIAQNVAPRRPWTYGY